MPGSSVYLEGHKARSEFSDRGAVYTGTAVVTGTGSDGEAVIDPRTIESSDIPNLSDIKEVYEYTVMPMDCYQPVNNGV